MTGRGVRLFTVGHSTRTFDELVELLRAFGVALLVDVRTIPRSRHNPQFDGDTLRAALRSRRIRYVHLPELGGLRHARKDSPNTAWRNASFRGFADYMATADFAAGIAKLLALAAKGRVAIMCAEAVPWRCHRSLVADALTARGAIVEHITSATRSSPHRITPFARVRGARVTYPGREGTRLATPAPFHLEATVRVLQRRPTNLVDVWLPNGRYVRALHADGDLALVEVADRGTIDAPDVHFTVLRGNPPEATRGALQQTMRRILGLDVEPEPLRRALAGRRRIAALAVALRGMRPPRFAGLFEAFGNVVPFQQVSLDAGVAIVGRVVARFGASLEHDGRRFHAFPEAHVVARARIDRLRACGLSRQKAETLRTIARAVASGALTETVLSRMSSADAVARLTELPGIGRWSASLVLLRGLGRLDVFPPGDSGATRGLAALTKVEPGAALDRVVERFGALRGYLYFCALAARLMDEGIVHAAPR